MGDKEKESVTGKGPGGHQYDAKSIKVLGGLEAVRLRPQMPEALNNLGNVLRELGRLDEAKQCYREALRLAPAIGMTYNNMAQALQEAGIARAGNAVLGGGEVTSGTLSPSLRRGIGMAYVPAARAAVGTRLEIDVRGKMRAAVIERKPLYRKAS